MDFDLMRSDFLGGIIGACSAFDDVVSGNNADVSIFAFIGAGAEFFLGISGTGSITAFGVITGVGTVGFSLTFRQSDSCLSFLFIESNWWVI